MFPSLNAAPNPEIRLRRPDPPKCGLVYQRIAPGHDFFFGCGSLGSVQVKISDANRVTNCNLGLLQTSCANTSCTLWPLAHVTHESVKGLQRDRFFGRS